MVREHILQQIHTVCASIYIYVYIYMCVCVYIYIYIYIYYIYIVCASEHGELVQAVLPEHILQQENTFYRKRTQSIGREHILQEENTVCTCELGELVQVVLLLVGCAQLLKDVGELVECDGLHRHSEKSVFRYIHCIPPLSAHFFFFFEDARRHSEKSVSWYIHCITAL